MISTNVLAGVFLVATNTLFSTNIRQSDFQVDQLSSKNRIVFTIDKLAQFKDPPPIYKQNYKYNSGPIRLKVIPYSQIDKTEYYLNRFNNCIDQLCIETE